MASAVFSAARFGSVSVDCARRSVDARTRGGSRCAAFEDEEVKTLPRIPVQPISYGDARRLLEPLRGPIRPKGFQGGLPFAYHVGGTNDVRVHLKTDIELVTKTIWDVITKIDGAVEKDRWVVLGNHRDAWFIAAIA